MKKLFVYAQLLFAFAACGSISAMWIDVDDDPKKNIERLLQFSAVDMTTMKECIKRLDTKAIDQQLVEKILASDIASEDSEPDWGVRSHKDQILLKVLKKAQKNGIKLDTPGRDSLFLQAKTHSEVAWLFYRGDCSVEAVDSEGYTILQRLEADDHIACKGDERKNIIAFIKERLGSITVDWVKTGPPECRTYPKITFYWKRICKRWLMPTMLCAAAYMSYNWYSKK